MASDDIVDSHYALSQNEETVDHLAADVLSKFMVNIDALKGEWSTLNGRHIKEELERVLIQAYETKETQVTPEIMRRMERMILLHVIDTKWKDHLHTMDQVKDGISLRALAVFGECFACSISNWTRNASVFPQLRASAPKAKPNVRLTNFE